MEKIHGAIPPTTYSNRRDKNYNASHGGNEGGCGCLIIVIAVAVLFYFLLS